MRAFKHRRPFQNNSNISALRAYLLFALWSLDHLFIDQDGIPTLVEVKRGTDTRIRREVVGQMLDYAANAVVYWPVESIRATFEAHCNAQGTDPAQRVAEFIDGGDPDSYWTVVKTNLQAGKIRMVFVADEVPPELQRIVEFLNGQMDPAEVLAVEIRHYIGENLRTLVPRVIGKTAAADNKTITGSATKTWDEASFFAALSSRVEPREVQAARRIYDWMRTNGQDVWWGHGNLYGSVYLKLHDPAGKPHRLIAMWTSGSVEVQLEYLAADPAFASEDRWLDLLHRLNALPGVNISPAKIAQRPNIPLASLSEKASHDQFIGILDWAIHEIKSFWK